MQFLVLIIIAFFPAFGPGSVYLYVDMDMPVVQQGEQGSYDRLAESGIGWPERASGGGQ